MPRRRKTSPALKCTRLIAQMLVRSAFAVSTSMATKSMAPSLAQSGEHSPTPFTCGNSTSRGDGLIDGNQIGFNERPDGRLPACRPRRSQS